MQRLIVRGKDGKVMVVNVPSYNHEVAFDGGSAGENDPECENNKYVVDGYVLDDYVLNPCN